MNTSCNIRIGIMGGTFSPIHNGHLLLAETARETYELDYVLFMPSGNSYMKAEANVPDMKHRAQMTELAIEGHPYFKLSTMELERSGPTYTCDTLAELRIQEPAAHFFFIMGADSLFTLEKWKNPEILLQECTIIAAVRGNESEITLLDTAKDLSQRYQADIRILPLRRIDISSSEIREMIAAGKSVRYMVPESVLEYIVENRMYQS